MRGAQLCLNLLTPVVLIGFRNHSPVHRQGAVECVDKLRIVDVAVRFEIRNGNHNARRNPVSEKYLQYEANHG